MAKPEDGYIKFKMEWKKGPIALSTGWEVLNQCRTQLFDEGLVGMYKNSIGFGNVSMRLKGSARFVITGTQTGHKRELNRSDYAEVTKFDIAANKVWCRGLVKASSESMTHAAIYAAFDKLNYVFHIHHPALWKKYKGKLPSTDPAIPYGTPQMAYAIQHTIAGYPAQPVIMGGHRDGIVLFGQSAKEALHQLNQLHTGA